MITVVISEVKPGRRRGLRNELIHADQRTGAVQVVGYARDGLEVAQLAAAAQARPLVH